VLVHVVSLNVNGDAEAVGEAEFEQGRKRFSFGGQEACRVRRPGDFDPLGCDVEVARQQQPPAGYELVFCPVPQGAQVRELHREAFRARVSVRHVRVRDHRLAGAYRQEASLLLRGRVVERIGHRLESSPAEDAEPE